MEQLLRNNAAWAAARTEADPGYFRRLSALQAPDYLWIGCSDSRVPANVITVTGNDAEHVVIMDSPQTLAQLAAVLGIP